MEDMHMDLASKCGACYVLSIHKSIVTDQKMKLDRINIQLEASKVNNKDLVAENNKLRVDFRVLKADLGDLLTTKKDEDIGIAVAEIMTFNYNICKNDPFLKTFVKDLRKENKGVEYVHKKKTEKVAKMLGLNEKEVEEYVEMDKLRKDRNNKCHLKPERALDNLAGVKFCYFKTLNKSFHAARVK
eukprot:TRINITY_DN2441_c2_g1_i1.p1 TRINITY_DN2441_c2_g1~~TRINITY_DN2441_c2_g1_i1.p1  ORF type:complete len:186 (-),score=40.44 TRINITY_DN2441_c2_g1_i1:196-753(-)